MSMNKREKSVVVIGAGVAGIQAALDLAEMGAKVHLIEETPSIGGRMPQLDKTFPTNDCSLCILAPKMSECARHPGITIHTCSELHSLEGKPGNFSCSIKKRATYIDPNKCVACGICEEKCPVSVEDQFDVSLRKRKAIYRYFLQSIPSHYVIDKKNCLYIKTGACRLCEKACPADAINFEDKDTIFTIKCQAVILASGIDPFNPIVYGQYGYGKYKDIVTSLEFERLLCASGPNRGHLECASTGKPPKKVAFIQCVGSRDLGNHKNYCSSVCCMYAIKQAVIAKEHIKDLDTAIFFMDMRAFGKDFDKYYNRAEKQYGVRFIRSRVGNITSVNGNSINKTGENIRLHFSYPDGTKAYEDFSMVVLSVGLEARKNTALFADKLDVKLDEYGFCRTETYNPLNTTRQGIFVCGALSGPKDIPESVMSASGAVGLAAGLLSLSRQEKVSQKEFPPEKEVIGDRPRIGAFVCHCGINIAGVVDVQQVVEHARTLPNVEYAQTLMYACSQDSMNTIKEKIKEYDLNRILVAACTPRTHEPLFRETLREAGLNQYLFEMANIRDQCSWAHMNEPELATEKAKDLVKMGIAKARNLVPLERLPIDINPNALVIGGGLAGITAALSLANAGFEVYLIEKETRLGGHLNDIYFSLNGDNPQEKLQKTIKALNNNKLIHVYMDAYIENISGYLGNFKTKIKQEGSEEIKEFEHGVIIVATGAEEHRTSDYLYGQNNRVITQMEFEGLLANGDIDGGKLDRVVMIQCVNSRESANVSGNGNRLYCSRICCSQAVKNALKLKESRPNTEIVILYRDIRTYGLKEKYFGEARDNNVIFMRYDLENKPGVAPVIKNDPNSRLWVTAFDPILGSEVKMEADLLVLSVAIDAPGSNRELAKELKVPLNQEDFFLEAHMKLRPVDFATDGIFVAGLAHGPKSMEESIIQANAAASRAMTLLSKKVIEAEGTVGYVDPDKCTGCGTCVEVCAYTAARINEETGKAEINDALCKGCGACTASCRCGAIDLKGFTDEQIFESITVME